MRLVNNYLLKSQGEKTTRPGVIKKPRLFLISSSGYPDKTISSSSKSLGPRPTATFVLLKARSRRAIELGFSCNFSQSHSSCNQFILTRIKLKIVNSLYRLSAQHNERRAYIFVANNASDTEYHKSALFKRKRETEREREREGESFMLAPILCLFDSKEKQNITPSVVNSSLI